VRARIAEKPATVSPSRQIVIATAFSILLALLLVRARLNYVSIPALRRRAQEGPVPDCMVVIPARNEQGSIGRAVRSLPSDTVIVVDDFSEDQTADEARKAGAGVLQAPAMPRGALGKPNACMAGASVLTSKWILFADADTWYAPGFLDSAIATAEGSGLDFLSIQLAYRPRGIMEHILTPYATALFFSGVNPRTDLVAAFNAQCLLVRRQPYEFLGGHGAVLSLVADDVRFAQLTDRHRMKKAMARSGPLGYCPAARRSRRPASRHPAQRNPLHASGWENGSNHSGDRATGRVVAAGDGLADMVAANGRGGGGTVSRALTAGSVVLRVGAIGSPGRVSDAARSAERDNGRRDPQENPLERTFHCLRHLHP